jgi:alkanesulfonate monooxygenase SsuD/methylene tetrahydromethanopterin reductase-like flavin-dependent oxidoreductase (luciferase family)
MLRLTGRLGEGWVPTLGERYMKPEDAPAMHALVDEGARRAGRDPAEIERAVNVMALDDDPACWADRLSRIAVDLRFSTLIVALPDDDPLGAIARLGEEVAPKLRERSG